MRLAYLLKKNLSVSDSPPGRRTAYTPRVQPSPHRPPRWCQSFARWGSWAWFPRLAMNCLLKIGMT